MLIDWDWIVDPFHPDQTCKSRSYIYIVLREYINIRDPQSKDFLFQLRSSCQSPCVRPGLCVNRCPKPLSPTTQKQDQTSHLAHCLIICICYSTPENQPQKLEIKTPETEVTSLPMFSHSSQSHSTMSTVHNYLTKFHYFIHSLLFHYQYTYRRILIHAFFVVAPITAFLFLWLSKDTFPTLRSPGIF